MTRKSSYNCKLEHWILKKKNVKEAALVGPYKLKNLQAIEIERSHILMQYIYSTKHWYNWSKKVHL